MYNFLYLSFCYACALFFFFSFFSDIDECFENRDICGYGYKCENVPGNHSCPCENGFELAEEGLCREKIQTKRSILPNISLGMFICKKKKWYDSYLFKYFS